MARKDNKDSKNTEVLAIHKTQTLPQTNKPMGQNRATFFQKNLLKAKKNQKSRIQTRKPKNFHNPRRNKKIFFTTTNKTKILQLPRAMQKLLSSMQRNRRAKQVKRLRHKR